MLSVVLLRRLERFRRWLRLHRLRWGRGGLLRRDSGDWEEGRRGLRLVSRLLRLLLLRLQSEGVVRAVACRLGEQRLLLLLLLLLLHVLLLSHPFFLLALLLLHLHLAHVLLLLLLLLLLGHHLRVERLLSGTAEIETYVV